MKSTGEAVSRIYVNLGNSVEFYATGQVAQYLRRWSANDLDVANFTVQDAGSNIDARRYIARALANAEDHGNGPNSERARVIYRQLCNILDGNASGEMKAKTLADSFASIQVHENIGECTVRCSIISNPFNWRQLSGAVLYSDGVGGFNPRGIYLRDPQNGFLVSDQCWPAREDASYSRLVYSEAYTREQLLEESNSTDPVCELLRSCNLMLGSDAEGGDYVCL